jgi:uncharacterized protein YegL
MKRAFYKSLLASLSLLGLLAFQNCSKVTFTGEPAAAASNVANGITGDNTNPTPGADPTCRVEMVNTTKPVKVLFLIDTSGSNQNTDAGKVWRLETINSFINVYGSKTNFEFGFATFQGTSAISLITKENHGVFSNNMTDINQAIMDFKNTQDYGATPYDAAIAVVKNMIIYDQSVKASKDVAYVVVMISDGMPTNTTYVDPATGMDALTKDVNSLLTAAPGQIGLNTVFLYNQSAPDTFQKSYLQKIADLGTGVFIEATSKQTLQISDTVQVPGKTCM